MAGRTTKRAPADETPAAPDLYDSKYYINRELSWLEFNRRCWRG